MCYFVGMSTIGVRDLRQRASEILREVEAGETATVTVAGRPVAQIVPLHAGNEARRWTTWERVQRIFACDTDPGWETQRREFGGEDLLDPWERSCCRSSTPAS
jgi:prevent-host-death family protein